MTGLGIAVLYNIVKEDYQREMKKQRDSI